MDSAPLLTWTEEAGARDQARGDYRRGVVCALAPALATESLREAWTKVYLAEVGRLRRLERGLP